MFWIKGCKRCGGDLYLEQDVYGTSVVCLQCGAVKNEVVMLTAPARPVTRVLELAGRVEHAA
ncbi:MAG: hypothetical protein HY669_01995 [Chloroflexi bacterium]|nr:hypothetical protein [Chloroflexota bacterium]